jgi:hypothetical protein
MVLTAGSTDKRGWWQQRGDVWQRLGSDARQASGCVDDDRERGRMAAGDATTMVTSVRA